MAGTFSSLPFPFPRYGKLPKKKAITKLNKQTIFMKDLGIDFTNNQLYEWKGLMLIILVLSCSEFHSSYIQHSLSQLIDDYQNTRTLAFPTRGRVIKC